MKDPDIKELAKTISDKARKKISIVAKLIIKQNNPITILFFYFDARVCQFTDETVLLLFTILRRRYVALNGRVVSCCNTH